MLGLLRKSWIFIYRTSCTISLASMFSFFILFIAQQNPDFRCLSHHYCTELKTPNRISPYPVFSQEQNPRSLVIAPWSSAWIKTTSLRLINYATCWGTLAKIFRCWPRLWSRSTRHCFLWTTLARRSVSFSLPLTRFTMISWSAPRMADVRWPSSLWFWYPWYPCFWVCWWS